MKDGDESIGEIAMFQPSLNSGYDVKAAMSVVVMKAAQLNTAQGCWGGRSMQPPCEANLGNSPAREDRFLFPG